MSTEPQTATPRPLADLFEEVSNCSEFMGVHCIDVLFEQIHPRAIEAVNSHDSLMEENKRLKADALRNFRWAYQLLLALARRRLEDANKDCGDSWPAGQEWHEMVGSSHSIFLRGAREEAGIPDDAFMGLIRSLEYDVDDLYQAALERKE